ncbi:hypothetical protein PIB30_064625 [Stylosanthes scabra]|uniref:F-box associated domain-containing protein n=1 Tax=Stylosanthes scabra TaxID=79078 RepID=A0ABU6UKM0_9FABA|nr:hypothetical protein [Stylosanthes scabra]
MENLRDHTRRLRQNHTFDDDIFWTIFVHTEPKVATRCRTLSKKRFELLKSEVFIEENFKATNQNSKWFLGIDAETGEHIPLSIPATINVFGHYYMVGSDHGNICVRVTESGINSRLLIWNPRRIKLHGVATKQDKEWTVEGTFESEVEKIGPYSIVTDGLSFLVGWDGIDHAQPNAILSFSFKEMNFSQAEIPAEVIMENNSLAIFNGGVGFITYREVRFSREVVVWDMYSQGHDTLAWERKIIVSGFAFLFSPSILVGTSILSILDVRTGYGTANNADRADLYIYKGRKKNREMDLLYHNYWGEDVQVKTIVVHSEGLFSV